MSEFYCVNCGKPSNGGGVCDRCSAFLNLKQELKTLTIFLESLKERFEMMGEYSTNATKHFSTNATKHFCQKSITDIDRYLHKHIDYSVTEADTKRAHELIEKHGWDDVKKEKTK